jgi:tetratricopeptide (TPR) repeat protein
VAVLWKYDPYQPYFLKVPRFILRAIVVPVIVGLVGVSTVRNVLRWSDDGVEQVNALASTMATELTDVDLYFGNCGFNSVLQLVMRDQDVKTRLVTTEPLLWSRAAFRTIVASWFEDSPRLASMAEIGAYPFFSAVVEDESRNVIIGDFPDLVYRQGLVPMPVMFGYRGVKEVDANELKTSQEALMTFWAGLDTEGLWDVGTVDQSQRATLSVRNMIAAESRRANNLGVLLEKEGETESNLAAYRMSRSLFPQNVSALLNLAFHMDTLPEQEQLSVKQEMEDLLTDMGKNRLNLWRMSDVYGYISHPMAHVQRGMGWAVSGKPNLAVREYRQALRQDPNSVALRLNLASALLADQETEQAEQAYIEVLSEDPKSVSALAGMLRVYAGRGDVQEARAYLERIRDVQGSSNFVYREELGLLALEGDMDGIRTLITKWRKEHADTLEPLLAGIALAMQDRDQEEVDLLLVKADQLSRYSPDERLKFARILFALSQPEKAKATLRPLMDTERYAVPAREILLQYAVGTRDQKSSIQYVLEILSREPRHAFAHYILGSIRYSQGRLPEAEASFRASLEQGDYAPALNDLAYLLLEKNRAEEALPYARKAVSGSAVSGGNWDTLASVLLDLGEVDEAYAAQVNAMNAAPESPSFRLTLARIYQAQGKRDEVTRLVEELYRVEDRLTVRQKNFLRELSGNDG